MTEPKVNSELHVLFYVDIVLLIYDVIDSVLLNIRECF